MAGSKEIRAGGAFVELFVKDAKMQAGLARAAARLKAFGTTVAAIGAAMSGIGAGLGGALFGAATQFANLGSELFVASQRTGVAVDALSSLKLAAEQSGASLADLEAGFKGIGKLTGAVAAGSTSAAKTLEMLGISAADFLAMTPPERFAAIADGIAKIKDPSLQAAAAQAALGRSGINLMEVLKGGAAGIAAAQARAQSLGLVVSPEQAAAANKLGSAFGELWAVSKATIFNIGAAVAEPLTKVITALAEAGAAVITFVKNNQGLVTIAAIVAGALVAVGTALVAIGGTALLLSTALAPIVGAFTAIGSLVAFLVTPMGMFTAAMVAVGAVVVGLQVYLAQLAVRWLLAMDAGKSFVSYISSAMSMLWGTITTTFKGIWDAIVMGNWELAGRIAMAGLNVAMQQGILLLMRGWEGFKNWLLNLWSDIYAGSVNIVAQMNASIFGMLADLAGNAGLGQLADSLKEIQAGNLDIGIDANIGAEKAKQKRAAATDKALKPYEWAVNNAQAVLEAATKEAADARAAAAAKAAAGPTQSQYQAKAQAAAARGPNAQFGGAFNAAAAALVSQSLEPAQQAAASLENIDANIEEMLGLAAEGGLVFGE